MDTGKLKTVIMGGPTLDDVTNAFCPDERPYKCLPYGVCFNLESYCSSSSRTVESCFPLDLLENEAELFTWCRQFTQGEDLYIPDPSCLYACFHRFNASKLLDLPQNALQITRLQTEVVVLISVLINWMVCGTILLVLITYCKAYRANSTITGPSVLWKRLTRDTGPVTRIHYRRAEEGACTDSSEHIELQLTNICDSQNTSKMASAEKHTRKVDRTPETARGKLQVVIDEHDINMKTQPSLKLQTIPQDDSGDLASDRVPNYAEACGLSEDARSLLDDVDLLNAISPRTSVQDYVCHE